jgi:nucleotide-binding universal stress UspA family protein
MLYKTILVATDFSENAQRAFERACDLARQLGAKLYLLHVHDESALRTAIREGLLREDSTDDQLQQAVAQLTEERFSQMMAGTDTSEVKIECLARRGDPKSIISNLAREIGADLVVVGRRGKGLIDLVVGSVTDCVIRNSPCPVLVVRRDHK